MNVSDKIDFSVTILDELVTVKFFPSKTAKPEAYRLIRKHLKDYCFPLLPTDWDKAIQQIKSLLTTSNPCFEQITALAEFSLSEAHNEYLDELERQ